MKFFVIYRFEYKYYCKTMIFIILLIFFTTSHATHNECKKQTDSKKCITDTVNIMDDECYKCKCEPNINPCKRVNEIVFDTSDCLKLRIDLMVEGDYYWQKYSYELHNYYNQSIKYDSFSGDAYHQDGYIINDIDADTVILTIKITTDVNPPSVLIGMICAQSKYNINNITINRNTTLKYNVPVLILLIIFVCIVLTMIVIGAIFLYKKCCEQGINQNIPY